MLARVGSSWDHVGALWVMLDRHRIIIVHLGPSLGPWDEKVAVVPILPVFSNPTIALSLGGVEILGVRGGVGEG